MRELITKERKKKKGFTLIELIIVLAIVAIIAAIAIPNFTKVRAESKSKADIQSAETIRRITLTLLADDKVLPGDKFTVTAGVATEPTSKKITATELSEYFKEVKKPQQDKGGKYEVEVDEKGNVKVVVGEVKVEESGATTTP
ncbi:prepilin-type N-terminal cleavage/methylation domain-containing protein [Clostridium algidicarnis]|uniref:prepilin-type N-terminal cleavage/methylation domain-containing protein n=1 Tax=Clostridium algidicarnis TaxID=37659 RepID=UPI001C0AE413|nr:prepilin-type N-terminal cleavage/methylation domain-containing protein [Clostridium algidicarnis]MBU3206709.1 prepilin-type N-terminal cleavage/methylation domain-containing protein [Clostridium algidicarnis]